MISRRNTAQPRVARDREVLVELDRERSHSAIAWIALFLIVFSIGAAISIVLWP